MQVRAKGWAAVAALAALAGAAASWAPTAQGAPGAAVAERALEAPSTDAQGDRYLAQLEAKWGGILREAKGWNDSSFRQFREGYRHYPASVFERALAARTFDAMMAALQGHAAARSRLAPRKSYALDALEPADAAVPQVMEAARLAAKALGDDAKDLVFIPITPCTVWDTRFATDANSAGIIANGVTRKFYTHFNGAGGSFGEWGGNPSCPETAQNAIGGRPYAVMMTVFTNDATGNGWVTVYRDGDPDPSQATISVYYAAGPTKTQTVISKSNRGYGSGLYDVAVTSRFASVHVAAVVTGYFIKPQATALECESSITNSVQVAAMADGFVSFPSCASGYGRTAGHCYPDLFGSTVMIEKGPNGCGFRNTTAGAVGINAVATCCRIPGR